MTDHPTKAGSTESPKSHRVAATQRRDKAPEGRFFLISDLEDAIAELPPVRAVRIMATEDAIEEIHVISTPDILPKALVRNIETLLLVRYGIRIDHRCLSIVQSLQEAGTIMHRPLIQTVRRVPATGGHCMEVELRVSAHVAVGRCLLSDDVNDMRAVALALIDAINQLTGQSRLDLREATLLDIHEHQLALVLIRWQGEKSDEWFTGTALDAGDSLMAVARATLDAVNRKLVRLPLQDLL
ncbi:MAG: hypothetical protein HZB53_04765 [Chloroflexi bacterium]|nr:hypothetical protein [Chloroflexota bacterium]